MCEFLHGFIRSGCTEIFGDHVRNLGSSKESSTLTLFRKIDCVLMSFFKADAIIASSTSESGKLCCPVIDRDVTSSSIALATWISLIHSMKTWGSAVRIQNFSSEIKLSALKFHRVRELSKIPFRTGNSRMIHHTNVRISSFSVIQKFHFYFGGEAIESAYSMIPFSYLSFLSLKYRVSNLERKMPNSLSCWRL